MNEFIFGWMVDLDLKNSLALWDFGNKLPRRINQSIDPADRPRKIVSINSARLKPTSGLSVSHITLPQKYRRISDSFLWVIKGKKCPAIYLTFCDLYG